MMDLKQKRNHNFSELRIIFKFLKVPPKIRKKKALEKEIILSFKRVTNANERDNIFYYTGRVFKSINKNFGISDTRFGFV